MGDTSMHTNVFGAAHPRGAEGAGLNAGQLGGVNRLGGGGWDPQRGEGGHDQCGEERRQRIIFESHGRRGCFWETKGAGPAAATDSSTLGMG